MRGPRECVTIRAGRTRLIHIVKCKKYAPYTLAAKKISIEPRRQKNGSIHWLYVATMNWVNCCAVMFLTIQMAKKKNNNNLTTKMKFFTHKSVSSKKINKSTVGNWKQIHNDEFLEVNSTIYAIINGTEMNII